MKQEHEILFQPLKIKNIELRNRIVVPPMVQLRPLDSSEGIAWYRRMAAGGAGAVILEGTAAAILGEGERYKADNLRPVVDAIHEQGAAAVIQLVASIKGKTPGINELTTEQVEQIIDNFGAAAKICAEAGFDGVEPHGAHGFLHNQFFMPDRNQRTDRFGGSFEKRCRLGVSIVHKIREAIGDRLTIFYRHTPEGEAYSVEDSLRFAKKLIDAGLDVLDISPARRSQVADLAAPFAAKLDIPVVAVGGMINPDAASEALRENRCELVAIGRGLITDAELPRKIAEKRLDEIVHCVECNECFGDLREGRPVHCSQWSDDQVAPFIR